MDLQDYESDELLNQYLLFHYGNAQERMPWEMGPVTEKTFPETVVSEGVDQSLVPQEGRALDVGCAVGRSTFELAHYFNDVVGIDYSDAFIMAGRVLCREGALPFTIKETGTITSTGVAAVPDVYCKNVSFQQGDAHELPASLGQFDLVLAANLLCRLADPRKFLERLKTLIVSGGQLIITTPNTWLESFTAKEYWLGATPETGEPLEALRVALEDAFDLVMTKDVPFVIREHKRKYQWSVAQLTRWVRKVG